MTASPDLGVAWRARARNVSTRVFHGEIAIGQYDRADLERELLQTINNSCWNPGEVLLVSTMVPSGIAQPMLDWMAKLGVRKSDLVDAGTMHACEGSFFHEDASENPYIGMFFCVAWLDETDPWDLYFPTTGQRIELHPGTIAFFDPAHVHGVVGRGKTTFVEEELGDSGVQPFASLNIKASAPVMRIFGSKWQPKETSSLELTWPRRLCPTSGQLLAA